MCFLPLVEVAAAHLRVVEEEEEVKCHLNLLTPDGTAFEEEAVRGSLWRAWSRTLIMDLPEEMGVDSWRADTGEAEEEEEWIMVLGEEEEEDDGTMFHDLIPIIILDVVE
mmetsp:Transcript_1957/g.3518  ORF Transcript_1957/g.3518 Transcript_1957/m.3518 type:complete len:110 (-) Transcript_1957:242-571(-)